MRLKLKIKKKYFLSWKLFFFLKKKKTTTTTTFFYAENSRLNLSQQMFVFEEQNKSELGKLTHCSGIVRALFLTRLAYSL